MATQQLIDIIIKATDQASNTAKKVDQQMKKVYDDIDKANSKAAKNTQKFNKELINTSQSFQVVGGGATHAAQMLQQVRMDPNFGSSIDRAKLKVSQMGYDISSVQGKIRVFGAAVPMAFNKLRTQVSSAATTLKGKLATAIDSVRTKLKSLSAGAKGLGGIFGGLKGIFSMTAGMIGYDLVTGIVNAARESINAASQVEYFGQRLNKMGGETHLSTEKFNEFKAQLGDLQKEFRKVDMTAVGATAEELAVKLNLPSEKLGDLTRMTAVLSSTFVKEGRSQEDAVLAVADAMDGQFKRLQEIGITQQTLMDNGWTGNLEDQGSLIDALNKSMQDMGYEQTAKDITNLDEAYTALTIAGGQLMQKVLVPITPILIQIIEAFLKVADAVGPIVSKFVELVSKMPDWAKYGGLIVLFGVALTQLATWINMTLIPALADAALAAIDFAIALMTNPIFWIGAALAAVAIAIYEVGKAFGWWTDVGSMLQAIWAGIQRLWSAFINHPDVQALIAGIKQAWADLQPYIQRVISWVKSFFTVSGNKNFDIVRALIDSLGATWNRMTLPIRIVIKVVKLFVKGMQNTYVTVRLIILKIRTLWTALPGMIRTAISAVTNIIVTPFRNAINGVKTQVGKIKSAAEGIKNISLSSITDKVVAPFRSAYKSVVTWVDKIKKKAKEATSNPLGGISSIFARGGVDLARGGEDLIPTNPHSKEELKVTQDINLSLDLRNVPPSINEDQLYSMIDQTLQSRDFIKALTTNSDFQTMDKRAKQRINAKTRRARGA